MTKISLPSNPKICILRLSAIGDVCHALSSVQAIQQHYPQAEITWIIGKIEYQLLKNAANINFVVFDKAQGLKAYSQLRKELRKTLKGQRFDILLQMQLAFRANLAAAFIPAKIKLGFSKQRSKELHSLFVNRHIENEKGFHVLDGFRDFARAIGVPDSAPCWQLPVSTTTLGWGEKQLPKQPYVVISPAASKAERDWLPQRYAAIADYCQTLGFPVLLTASPAIRETQLVEAILACCETQPANLAGKTNLQQLLVTLKQAELVIAPDSGPAHMAVTQATPVIGLYAHSNPRRTGPYLSLELVADAYSPLAQVQFDRPAEQLEWGLRLKGEQLMAHISEQQVKTLIDKVLHNES